MKLHPYYTSFKSLHTVFSDIILRYIQNLKSASFFHYFTEIPEILIIYPGIWEIEFFKTIFDDFLDIFDTTMMQSISIATLVWAQIQALKIFILAEYKQERVTTCFMHTDWSDWQSL